MWICLNGRFNKGWIDRLLLYYHGICNFLHMHMHIILNWIDTHCRPEVCDSRGCNNACGENRTAEWGGGNSTPPPYPRGQCLVAVHHDHDDPSRTRSLFRPLNIKFYHTLESYHTQVLSIILFLKKKLFQFKWSNLKGMVINRVGFTANCQSEFFRLSGLWNRKCCCLPIANAGILTWKRFKVWLARWILHWHVYTFENKKLRRDTMPVRFDLPVGYYMYVPSKKKLRRNTVTLRFGQWLAVGYYVRSKKKQTKTTKHSLLLLILAVWDLGCAQSWQLSVCASVCVQVAIRDSEGRWQKRTVTDL